MITQVMAKQIALLLERITLSPSEIEEFQKIKAALASIANGEMQ